MMGDKECPRGHPRMPIFFVLLVIMAISPFQKYFLEIFVIISLAL